MSLGVERSEVGDILPESGRCVVFVRSELADYFCLNLRKIGNVGVRVQEGAEMPLPLGHEFQGNFGVVASQRLDCIVALLCKTSREKASGLIFIRDGCFESSGSAICFDEDKRRRPDICSWKGKIRN